jgi:hypothetical protein
MVSGAKARKVCNHSTTVDIIVIEWSSSRKLLESADDSGKVIVKRLRIKPDAKWASILYLTLGLEKKYCRLFLARMSDTCSLVLRP